MALFCTVSVCRRAEPPCSGQCSFPKSPQLLGTLLLSHRGRGVCTASPPWQPFSERVPGPWRGHRPWLQGKLRQGCQTPMPVPRGKILKVHHAPTTSSLPCRHGYLLFLGKQAKRSLRERFAITPLALPSSWDSSVLTPWASPSCRHRAARGALATAISERENVIPSTGSTWEREQGDIPNALYSSPLGRLSPGPTKAGCRSPKGLASIVR